MQNHNKLLGLHLHSFPNNLQYRPGLQSNLEESIMPLVFTDPLGHLGKV